MKFFLHFSAILFVFIIGVSCSSSDDELLTPTSTPVNNPVENTPIENNPAVTPPIITITEWTPTDAIMTFKADLKPDGVTTINYATNIGNITLLLNQTNQTFKLIDVGADNFNPRYINMHTTDGIIVFVFPYTIFSSTSPSIYKINDGQIKELIANHYYVNFKGADGDINGQLIKQ